MRLLLAEDERALSNVLVTILKHNNYTVDAVYNGADALDYLACATYDGVILDIMMPKVDGIEVLKTIRAAGNKVPVLLLTAKSEVDDNVAGLDCGADDYLTKPFVTKELLARLRAIMRRQGGEVDNSLTFGDLRLDRASFELFMKNPAQVISAERLMERIWGVESDAEINVVWTYISYLRKKLKLLGSLVSIKAVRNIGYTLECGDA